MTLWATSAQVCKHLDTQTAFIESNLLHRVQRIRSREGWKLYNWGKWAVPSTILICFCSLLIVGIFAISFVETATLRICFTNSSDPLVTLTTVGASFLHQIWALCPNVYRSFCRTEWTYLLPLGMMCARSVIPNFRRILCPTPDFKKESHTKRSRGRSTCGRGAGRCGNHAARCHQFYMNDCIGHKCQYFFNRQPSHHTSRRRVEKNTSHSARFLTVAIPICFAMGMMVVCVSFAQQWKFTCGSQQGILQGQTHHENANSIRSFIPKSSLWWTIMMYGLYRGWIFPDWFKRLFVSKKSWGMMRFFGLRRFRKIPSVWGAAMLRCIRHHRVCQKCDWPAGFEGIRVGEAKNPGPPPHDFEHTGKNQSSYLDIGCFNPTQLYGKEESIIQWGQGIYCASETSATQVAQKLTRNTMRKAGFNVVFSEPVLAQRPSISQIRGRASGTAIITNFPTRPFWEPLSQPIADTQRAVDTVVQIHTNVVIYVASIYGISHMNPHVDPITATNSIFNEVAERALTFQGPAVITGDLNCNMDDIYVWESMTRQGWQDAAQIDSIVYGRDMQPTCRELTRKSFILVNPKMVDALIQCRTCEDFLFSAHPLLLGQFRMPTLIETTLQWVLPPTTDDYMFDDAVAEVQAQEQYATHRDIFHQALENQESNKAAHCFVDMIQNTWRASCVDCEGKMTHIKPGCLQRCNIHLLRPQHCSTPITKKGRQSDFEPGIGQMNIEQRRHTRQLRRIESLSSQLKACSRDPQQHKIDKCQELWESIRTATGFHKGFATWVGQHLQWFVPYACPTSEYIDGLKDAFRAWHSHNLQKYFQERKRARKISIALDISKGGSRAFSEIREQPALPLTYVVQNIESQICPVRWQKNGLTKFKLRQVVTFDKSQPVTFQGQKGFITSQCGAWITVDRPWKLRTQNFKISQQFATARNSEMHQITSDAWNAHWQRDDPRNSDGLWDDVMPLIERIPNRPEKAFRPFTIEDWNSHKKGLKVRSARGGCGFSVKEMINFPDQIVKALFEIWEACEQGMEWPENWITARVTMLAKTNRPSNPYDTRPITVLSVLYRQWSRFRSREILKYFQEFMPTEIALATNRVPAEAAAALVAIKVEHSINTNRPIAGFGLDLQRCFNTVPRPPLEVALLRMGVPKKYVVAWFQMLCHFRRTLCIANQQGQPMKSYTGIPEGCGMSVVGMAALTWWEAKVVTYHFPHVDPHGFADNWNLVTTVPRDLLPATRVLEDFVSKLKMTINGKKSWLWGTTPTVRKSLKGFRIGNCDIPVVCNFSDLGCDISYSRKNVKPKHKIRVTKSKLSLGKIRDTKVPRSFKVKMIKTASHPMSSYGSNLHHTAKSTWKTIRANIAKALGLVRSGASSGLAATITNADPELSNLRSACHFWRRFFRYFPQWKTSALTYLVQPGRCKTGPMTCLRQTFCDAKWTVTSHFTLKNIVSGFELNWLDCSTKHLKYMLDLHWSTRIQELVGHRKDWDISFTHIPILHRALEKRDEKQKWILHTYLSGKTGTYDMVSKFAFENDGMCPFCKQPDSKIHRLFHCKSFQEVRKQHCSIVKKFSNQPIATRALGFPTLPSIVWNKPDFAAADRFNFDKLELPPEGGVRYFFVDGSAFHQEYKELAIAGYAVVESTYQRCNFKLLENGVLPMREHNSYRGEVCGIIRAMVLSHRAVIYSDCEAAITVFNNFRVLVSCGGTMPMVEHSDLWIVVWQLLQSRTRDAVTLVKVKAHVDPTQLTDPHLQWLAQGNNFADQGAKDGVIKHKNFPQLAKQYDRYTMIAQDIQNYHTYLCEHSQTFFQLEKTLKANKRQREVNQEGAPCFDRWVPREYHNVGTLCPYDELPQPFPFGQEYYFRLCSWFNNLRWDSGTPVRFPTQGISILELYADFIAFTKSYAPLNFQPRGVLACWELLDKNPHRGIDGFPLSRFTTIWWATLRWIIKFNVSSIALDWGTKAPVAHIGYSLRCPHIDKRPLLACQHLAYKRLWKYFNPEGGKRRNTSSPLDLNLFS